jgi:hypothetical protein
MAVAGRDIVTRRCLGVGDCCVTSLRVSLYSCFRRLPELFLWYCSVNRWEVAYGSYQ